MTTSSQPGKLDQLLRGVWDGRMSKTFGEYWQMRSRVWVLGQRPYALSWWPWPFPLTPAQLVSSLLSSLDGVTARLGASSKTGREIVKGILCVSVKVKMWGALGRTPLVLLAVLASGSLVDAVDEKCFCSGVASQCREATSYYWATLRQAFRLLGWTIKCWTLRLQAKEEEHGFKLTDKEQEEEMEVEYQPESRYHPAHEQCSSGSVFKTEKYINRKVNWGMWSLIYVNANSPNLN